MEERVRICDGCSAVVGWFARFCEECGAPQQPKAEVPVAVAVEAAAETSHGAAAGNVGAHGARTGGAAATVAAEAVVAEALPEARTAARELFRAQLRLMHRTSEQAEALVAEIRGVRTDVAAARKGPSGNERRERLAGLSERLMGAEAAWDEIQRVYNRESESAEEEWQSVAEGAQVDAYLTPAEEDAVGGEFAALHRRFETAEAELRDAGREVARARKEAQSTIFGIEAASRGVLLCSVAASLGLCAVSFASVAERLGVADAAIAFTPALLAVLVLGFVAAKRG